MSVRPRVADLLHQIEGMREGHAVSREITLRARDDARAEAKRFETDYASAQARASTWRRMYERTEALRLLLWNANTRQEYAELVATVAAANAVDRHNAVST